MDIRLYTDKDYVPLKDLSALGEEFVTKTEEYRRSFMELVVLDDLNFVNIVETPALVKKRFSINVELKGRIDLQAENHDFILEIAKAIANGKDVEGISIVDKDKLIKKFEENNRDLTIITEYITKNIEKLLTEKTSKDTLNSVFPELTKFDIEFIKNNSNEKLNYSIQNYQDVTSCSYETGRKSLEKLTELNLYSKTKVGKKFVYKPTQKLITYVKGGN